MEKKNKMPNDSLEFRIKAEEILKSRSAGATSLPTEAELLKLVHEFDVYQIELELQNTELQNALAEARDAVDLYDFAPIGYFTLSDAGFIKRLNLSGAAMLGKERSRLGNSLFASYISSDTKSIFNLFLHDVFNIQTLQSCEVTLSVHDDTPAFVQITGIVNGQEDHCLVTVTDITHHLRAEEAIKQSEERYRYMFSNSPELMWIFDLETLAFLEVNQAAVFLYGYSAEEFLSMTIKDIRPMEDIAILLKSVEPTNRTYNQLGEFRHIKKNGEIIDVLITWHSVIFKGRKARHVLVNDITKRKLAEKALSESEARFRRLYESASLGIFQTAPDGKVISVNPAFAKMFGYNSPDELKISIKNDAVNLFTDINRRDEIIRLVENDPRLNTFENTYSRKDGSTFIGWLKVTRVLDEEGRFSHMEGFVEDITDRKLAEEALKESEEKYRLIVENVGEGFGFVNAEEQFLLANKAAEMIFGVGPGCLVNMNLNQFISKEQSEIVQKETSLRTHGIQSVYEMDIIQPSGKICTISLTAVPKNDKDGIFLGTYGIFSDITERKRIEVVLKVKNEELQKLNATKDKFFSIIAHDLKSPFNSILGFSQILEEQMKDKDYTAIEKYSKIINDSSLRAMNLLANLMEWALSQTGRMEFNLEYCDMVLLINEVTLLSDDSAQQKSITIKKFLPRIIRIFADKAMLSTVVRNLISNAIKFTMPGGRITISMEQMPNEIIFIVQDTGIGMSKSHMEKMFRIDESSSTPGTQREKGTGLGLILCKDFIEKHGGKIWVESEVGKGSVFKFSLPV
ncbi:MAG: PAS domain S-box protein [Bacteroidia bacterium]